MRKTAWLAFFLTLGSFAAHADEAATLFRAATDAYERADYGTAIDLYEQIIGMGKASWQIYYNLGNAYFRSNQLGRAILNYERARRMNPDEEDIRFNLEYANLRVLDRVPAPPKPSAVVWLESLILSPSFTTVLWLSLGFYALGLLLLAAKFYAPKFQKMRLYRFALWTDIILFVLFFSLFSYRWYKRSTEKFAIVLVPEISVNSSPAEDAKEIFALHEGTKVQVQERSAEWVRIRLRDGKVGWLQSEAIEEI